MASFREILDDAIHEHVERQTHRREWTPHPYGHAERAYREVQDVWRRQQQAPTTRQASDEGVVPACLRVLGLGGDCSVADVKRAFRRRAREAHPDTPTGSHDAFVALGRAYEQALSVAQ